MGPCELYDTDKRLNTQQTLARYSTVFAMSPRLIYFFGSFYLLSVDDVVLVQSFHAVENLQKHL